jgi:3-hydroxybutyryl-CoA dehydrogenase
MKDEFAVAVVGAGMMGSGIAAVASLAGHPVVLVDRGEAEVERGLQQARACVDQLRDNGLASADAAARVTGLLSGSTDMAAGCRAARLIIEAVTENLALKQKLFQELDSLASPDAVITSNTSGLRITDISRMAVKAARMATTHFWFPAHLVPLVEVVMGERTREETARWLHGVLLGWGKVPVIVRRDLPGQLANRIQQALIREAICLVQDGVASPEDVDMAIKMSMGIRLPVWGPLEHIDAVGLDLALSVQKDVLSSLDHSPQPPELLAQKVREGNLGHRTGKGFYDWSRKSMPELLARRDRFIMQALRIIREERRD